jgi:hypothetical protein
MTAVSPLTILATVAGLAVQAASTSRGYGETAPLLFGLTRRWPGIGQAVAVFFGRRMQRNGATYQRCNRGGHTRFLNPGKRGLLRLRALAALLMMSVVVSRVNAEDRATIVGSWKVISYDIEFQISGERRPLLGAQPHGYLIFTPQGRMMSYLEAEARKVPTTDEECEEAYWTMVAYTGKYRLEGNKWITNVDGAWNVEFVGTEQERTFELKGNRLSVTTSWTPQRYDSRLTRVHLTLERED